MKIEKKAQSPKNPGFFLGGWSGGCLGDLRQVCARPLLKIEFSQITSKFMKKCEIFLEKMKFYPEDPKYALQTFSRQSSDYLRHSVLSPKRFGQKEMKIEQKARPPPKIPHFGGGQGGYLDGFKGSMR